MNLLVKIVMLYLNLYLILKLEDFIRDYNVMYDGQKANFDDKGRVIDSI